MRSCPGASCATKICNLSSLQQPRTPHVSLHSYSSFVRCSLSGLSQLVTAFSRVSCTATVHSPKLTFNSECLLLLINFVEPRPREIVLVTDMNKFMRYSRLHRPHPCPPESPLGVKTIMPGEAGL